MPAACVRIFGRTPNPEIPAPAHNLISAAKDRLNERPTMTYTHAWTWPSSSCVLSPSAIDRYQLRSTYIHIVDCDGINGEPWNTCRRHEAAVWYTPSRVAAIRCIRSRWQHNLDDDESRSRRHWNMGAAVAVLVQGVLYSPSDGGRAVGMPVPNLR